MAEALEFGFRTDAPGMENWLLVFRVESDAEQYTTIQGWAFDVADEDLPEAFDVPETDCDAPFLWEGYLVTGNLIDLVEQLECGEFFNGPWDVEPSTIDDRSGGFVRSLRFANADRTRATTAPGCLPLEWAADLQEYYFVCGCFAGDVTLAPGFNMVLGVDAGQNAIALSAQLGRGDGVPCAEQPLHDGEVEATNRDTYSGALTCGDVITSLNGLAAAKMRFLNGVGVSITTVPTQNRIIIDASMLGLAVVPDMPPDEAVPCDPPTGEPGSCGPLDPATFECPDPPPGVECTAELELTVLRAGGTQNTILKFIAVDPDNNPGPDAAIETLRYFYNDRTDTSFPFPSEFASGSVGLGWDAAELETMLDSLTELEADSVVVTKGTEIYLGRVTGYFTLEFDGAYAGELVPFGIAWNEGFMTPDVECEAYLSAANVFVFAPTYADGYRWVADFRTIQADPCDRAFEDGTTSDHMRGYAQVGGPVATKHRLRVLGSPDADGTYTLTFDGYGTSVPILCNAAPSDVQDALIDLIGAGVVVTGSSGRYEITYGGALVGTDVALPDYEIDACPANPTTTTEPAADEDFVARGIISDSVHIWIYSGSPVGCPADPTCGVDIPRLSPLYNATLPGTTYTRPADDLLVDGDAGSASPTYPRWLSGYPSGGLTWIRPTIGARGGGSEQVFKLLSNDYRLGQQFFVGDDADYELTIEHYNSVGEVVPLGNCFVRVFRLGRWYEPAETLTGFYREQVFLDYLPVTTGLNTVTFPLGVLKDEWPSGWGDPPANGYGNFWLEIQPLIGCSTEIASIRLERV